MKVIKKADKPETVTINGIELKCNYDAGHKAYPFTNRQPHNIAEELKAQGLQACIVEVLSRNLKGKLDFHNQPYKPSVYKLKIIDGNDGSSDSEYYLTKEDRDSEADGIESPYFYERSTITFKESVFA